MGDQCNFAHDDGQLAITHHSAIPDDEEGPIVWHMLLEDEAIIERHMHPITNPDNDTDNDIYQLDAPAIEW